MSQKSKPTPSEDSSEFKVADRRRWADDEDGSPSGEQDPNAPEASKSDDDEQGDSTEEVTPRQPTIIDEYRQRTESAEQKLHEYIDAFKQFRMEQEGVRERLNSDVDRRVTLQFGELVGDLLGSVDELDMALAHAGQDEASQTFARGVQMVRNKFIETLERRGVERVTLDGEEFDPNIAEAIRLDPVDDSNMNGKVTQTLRPGYRVGDHVIRAAQVAVGRHDGGR
jgi:molecular chaperone GrpE